MRILGRHLVVAGLLAMICQSPGRAEEAPGAAPGGQDGAALQQPPASHPKIPEFPIHKFVPTGAMRTLVFMAALNPDCSTKGEIVARIRQAPQHGSMDVVPGEDFTAFGDNSPLRTCNTHKSPGLKIQFTPQPDFKGDDASSILFLYPDGSAAIMNFDIHIL